METDILSARARTDDSCSPHCVPPVQSRENDESTAAFLPVWIAATYLLLLSFPQVLFAHELSYRNLRIYSREPLDKSIYDVLGRVESRPAASEINAHVKPRIFLTNGFDPYALLSLFLGRNSFGTSYAALPTDNVFINKADAAKALVFRSAAKRTKSERSDCSRNHSPADEETVRLLAQHRHACLEEGGVCRVRRRWLHSRLRHRRQDVESKSARWYRVPILQVLHAVRYLLEHDKLTIDALVAGDFDIQSLEQRVLDSLVDAPDIEVLYESNRDSLLRVLNLGTARRPCGGEAPS